MATGTTDNEEKNAGNTNSAFVRGEDSVLPNGFEKSGDGISSLFNVQLASKKWLGLANTRRYANDFSRQGLMSRQGTRLNKHLGLEPDVLEDDSLKSTPDNKNLDRELLKHFVKLAKDNDYEDEVDINFIEDLLSKGANINCSDKYGQSVLHEAARAWHPDIARFLLDRGADINKTDKFGRTALHIAAATDYPEMVQILLEKGANIEALTRVENQTPLHFAARNDATESLKVLLKLDANIEAKDYKNRTPLFVAAELDRSDTARFLIDSEADATVFDSTGQLCMTSMITNMGPVARQALNQFHYKDRANRRQYYFLNLLESTKKTKKMAIDDDEISLAKSPLDVIVYYKQLDLIMHPVIMRMIDVKWNQFGRRGALRALALNVIFVLIWTILGVGVPWYNRYQYIFPTAGWRVLMLILGMLFAMYNVCYEVMEIILSRQRFEKWKNWRAVALKRDLEFCHAKWPEEEKYLRRQINSLNDLLPNYFQDFWNYFDWAVYLQIFLVFITHIVDVAILPGERVDPCCSIDNTTFCVAVDCRSDIAVVNNASLALWNNRFHVVLIISLWLRIMKDTRAFRHGFLGPFIVMLGKMTTDVVRFLYLYLEFYIPYACGFWMIFGQVSSISSMFTVDSMLFSLFRITLVDDYQYDEMEAYDIVMAYILVGTFLGISAILCINLFIALMSDTFQRVYDNANANAVMQQATLLLTIEENQSSRSRKKFKKYIQMKCSPEDLFYDDDLTVAQDEDLKKVTIRIKEQMDDLMEKIDQGEMENRLMGHVRNISNKDNARNSMNDTPRRRKSVAGKMSINDVLGIAKNKGMGVSDSQDSATFSETGKIMRNVREMSIKFNEIQKTQNSQESLFKELRRDNEEIKQLLHMLVPGSSRLGGISESTEWGQRQHQQVTSLLSPDLINLSPQQSSATPQKRAFFKNAAASLKQSFGGSGRKKNSVVLDLPSGENSGHHVVEMVSLPGSVQSPASSIGRQGGIETSQSSDLTVAGVRTAEITTRRSDEGRAVIGEGLDDSIA